MQKNDAVRTSCADMRIGFVAGFLTLGFECKEIISYMRYTLRILIVSYSRLRIVLDNNVSDNSFIIGNISRHYRQNRIIGRRLPGGAFLQAVTRNFLVT